MLNAVIKHFVDSVKVYWSL